MSELTLFQRECERLLRDIIDVLGFTILGRQLEGEEERYLHMMLGPSPVEVWIYEDQVEYRVNDRGSASFGMDGYSDSVLLLQEFSESLSRDLRREKTSG